MKIIYLLALALALFLLRDPWVIGALLLVQLALWIGSRLPGRALLQATRRLWLFFAIIIASYLLMREPLAEALLMCARVLTLVLASSWVQRSSPPGALVTGLQQLRVPESVAVAVDATLALVGGEGGGRRGGGHGDGGGRGHGGARESTMTWQDVKSGRLEFLTTLVDRSLRRAREWLGVRYPTLSPERLHDLTIIVAVGVAVMGLKVLQVLPGLPIASGHKNLLIVPLLLFAAHATRMRFGAFAAGTAVGLVSFMLGYGKYGILEVAHFAVPGLLADLLMPLARATGRIGRLIQYALIGVILGAGRFAANLLVIVLAGAPLPAFIFFAPMLASQIIFGALSCFVSLAIVRKIELGNENG